MNHEQVFGLIVRCSGLLSFMYGCYYMFGNSWRMMALTGQFTYYFWALLGSIPYVLIGVLVIGAAPTIVKISYPGKE